MSKKARRGMHIRINWPLLRLGVPEDFSNAESLTLHISRANNNVKTFIPDTHMSITGNVVSFIVTSEIQKALTSGEYKATISYRKVSATSPTLWEPYILDKPCFTLVDSSEDLGGTTDGMEVITIELDGEIGLPKEALPGASAYQIAVAHGFEGDEAEWLYSLKKPALDAAMAAAIAANAANDAADAADVATSELNTVMQLLAQSESGRVQAEQGRVNTESSRQQAEVVRNTNEGERNQAETAREQAESSRVQAEQGRSTAESGRVQAEAARNTKEGDRNQSETAREQAESSRVQAEQGRSTAEQAREQAEQDRTEAESARETAENSRTEAEQSRETAETARTQAEQDRGTTFDQKIEESEQATAAANTAAVAQNTYNVTVAVPLTAGSYYTKSTARAAVPAVSRKLGLVITYSTADKIWYTEKYIGSTVAGWATEANWEQVPDAAKLTQFESDLNNKSKKLSIISESINVFNSTFEPGGISNVNGSNITVAGQIRSGFIDIVENKNYIISCSSTSEAAICMIFVYNNGVFIDYITTSGGAFPKSFISSLGVNQARIVINNANVNTSKFQIEEGDTASEYIAPYVIDNTAIQWGMMENEHGGVDILIDGIEKTLASQNDFKKITEYRYSKNIFNSTWSESGKSIDLTTGKEKDIANFRRTGFIEVVENTAYTASSSLQSAPGVYVLYYTEAKNYIGYTSTVYGFYPKTFTTVYGARFIRIIHTSGDLPVRYQIELGSIATPYEEFFTPYLIVPTNVVYGYSNALSISGKRWLFLGDSITAMSGDTSWVNKFKILAGANINSYNQAVGGAKWCDDEPNIIYNGTPYISQNYIGNQVEWVKNTDIVGVDIDGIIVFAGTNDTNINFPSDEIIETAFYLNGDSNLIPIDSIDRSTWQGAIRWTVQSLRDMFPNAKIFIVTPLQRQSEDQGIIVGDMYPIVQKKRTCIEKMAKRLSVSLIDTSECDISDMQNDRYVDGLHLSVIGSRILAEFVYRKIIQVMFNL